MNTIFGLRDVYIDTVREMVARNMCIWPYMYTIVFHWNSAGFNRLCDMSPLAYRLAMAFYGASVRQSHYFNTYEAIKPSHRPKYLSADIGGGWLYRAVKRWATDTTQRSFVSSVEYVFFISVPLALIISMNGTPPFILISTDWSMVI